MEIEGSKGCILEKDMQELDNNILPSTIMVAIDGAKSSKFALKWTLNTYLSVEEANLKLIHIRPPITMVPTPMGNHIPISQLRDDIVSAYRRDIEWQTNAMILPYKEICKRRQVDAEIMIKEADDVAEGIAEEIGKLNISKLVIGASSRNMISRKLKGFKMSTKLSECSPSFCTIFVIKNGKLHAVRPGMDESSKIARISTNSSCASSISDLMDADTLQRSLLTQNFSLEIQCAEIHTIKNIKSDDPGSPCSILHSRKVSSNSEDSSSALSFSTSEVHCSKSKMSSYRNYRANLKSWSSELFPLSDDLLKFSFLENEDFEHEKLKFGLRNDHVNFEITEKASDVASQQKDEWAQFKENSIQEEDVKETSIEQEASQIGIVFSKEFTRAVSLMGDTNCNATRASKEKQRLEKSHSINEKQYNTYTWEEIKSATSSFTDKLKIGTGANGTVYKGTFHQTIAAVKILNSNEDYGTKQLKQEIEILSKVRHPHLLKLLGACLERGCLVYEYMENGSLDDLLHCKHNTPPLPWYYRFRIAREVASALLFLHNAKPVPIVHRDLKPANILLNENFVSKIGDVGLSTILPSMNSMGTLCKDTSPVGTFFYIDPEYHRTGLVSPKSDTYALGMVILQLLTAKHPGGLAHTVEMALEDGTLMELLDHKAGQWPNGPAHELAHLGVSCSELRRKDRPDLNDQVLPLLNKLIYFFDKDSYLAPENPIVPPRYFTCPIHKEVMEDPCIASDGYVYDRKSIEIWFHTSDKSPITDLILPNKNLLSNLSLHSAITEWKAVAK